MAKLTAIQLTSVPDVEQNLATIDRLMSQLPYDEHHLVVLPECCLYFGGKDAEQLTLARDTYQEETSELILALAELAKKHRVFLVAGTLPYYRPQADKFSNRCCVFSPEGELIEYYDKIHLFDVVVEDNEKNYLESKYTQAGEAVKQVNLPFTQLGLTVCYDLRFPELYRALAAHGANVITVPAAFTKVTGQAHWQALLQARAIENQCYIIAADQEGTHANGRETYGHSMIISPWGEILACQQSGHGTITVNYDAGQIEKIRKTMPVHRHNKFTTELVK